MNLIGIISSVMGAGFVALVSLATLALPQPDPLAPVAGFETRYMLVDGPDSRRVSRGAYDAYLSSCSNGRRATTPIVYPALHVRVFACDV